VVGVGCVTVALTTESGRRPRGPRMGCTPVCSLPPYGFLPPLYLGAPVSARLPYQKWCFYSRISRERFPVVPALVPPLTDGLGWDWHAVSMLEPSDTFFYFPRRLDGRTGVRSSPWSAKCFLNLYLISAFISKFRYATLCPWHYDTRVPPSG